MEMIKMEKNAIENLEHKLTYKICPFIVVESERTELYGFDILPYSYGKYSCALGNICGYDGFNQTSPLKALKGEEIVQRKQACSFKFANKCPNYNAIKQAIIRVE